MDEQQARVDFFISYTTADREWAEWVAWQLEIAGYSVTLQAWDFRPGRDFLHEMNRATTNARRTIAILSPDYFASEFGEAEWRTAFAQDPTGERGLLVPVRVRNFQPAGLLATRVYIDLVDTNAAQAVDALLRGVSDRGARPTQEPPFPGAPPDPAVTPRFPGSRSSGRLRLFESYRAASSSAAAGDALISLFPEAAPGDLPSHVAIKRSDFESLHDLLDELFISCLHRRVSPYSYGAEWILKKSFDLIVAPAGWVRDPTQPIRRMAPEWAASASLEAVGIGDDTFLEIADPATVQPYAMVTDNARLGRIIVDNPKAMAVLRHHVKVVRDDTYHDRKIQFVLRDWLNLGLVGKVLTDNDLTPEALDSISREYRLD